MIRIDAHHHIWRIDRGDYGWLTPDMAIHRDYALDDLRPLLADIEGTILIQAAPTDAETAFLLDAAHASDGLVRGVVGWADLAAPDAPDRIAALAADSMLKGLRPMLQDMEDTRWILRPEVRPALRAMTELGLRLDLLIEPRHIPHLLVLADRHPDLAMVIDHGAKPDIAKDVYESWAEAIAMIAKETPVFCKLSGLPAVAPFRWQMNDIRRYADHLLDSFGPRRLMWGSDWPVVELAGGYTRWKVISERLMFRARLADRPEIFGGTAARFYGIS